MKVIAILIFALALSAFALAQEHVSSSKLLVTANPGAGKVVINNLGLDNSFTLFFTEIQEIDAINNGVVNAINSFNNANFQTGGANFTTFQSVNSSIVTVQSSTLQVVGSSGNVTGTANLNLQINVIQANGSVSLQGQTFTVSNNNAVVMLQLSNWPALSPRNKLNIGMRLQTASKSGALSSNELRLDDGASITFPTSASLSSGNDVVTLIPSISNTNVDFAMQVNATTSTTYYYLYTVVSDGSEESPSAASTLSPLFAYLF